MASIPVKSAEAPVFHPGPRLVPKPKRSQIASKYTIADAAEQSLQVVAEEFKKICESNILRLKGRYSANAALIFNSQLKDIDMCVHDHKLTEHEVV